MRTSVRRSDGRYALERLIESDRTLGHWSSSSEDGYRTIYHYETAMLTFPIDSEGNPNPETLHMSLGYGSVSDQGGMNRLFRALDVPFYYSRKGGADISLVKDEDEWAFWPIGNGHHGKRVTNVSVADVLKDWPVRLV